MNMNSNVWYGIFKEYFITLLSQLHQWHAFTVVFSLSYCNQEYNYSREGEYPTALWYSFMGVTTFLIIITVYPYTAHSVQLHTVLLQYTCKLTHMIRSKCKLHVKPCIFEYHYKGCDPCKGLLHSTIV